MVRSDRLSSFLGVMRKFVTEFDCPVLRPEVLWPPGKARQPVRWEAKGDQEKVTIELDEISKFRPVPCFPDTFLTEFRRFVESLLAEGGPAYSTIEFGAA